MISWYQEFRASRKKRNPFGPKKIGCSLSSCRHHVALAGIPHGRALISMGLFDRLIRD